MMRTGYVIVQRIKAFHDSRILRHNTKSKTFHLLSVVGAGNAGNATASPAKFFRRN